MIMAKAINAATYMINCGPYISLNERFPEEVWSGKEVNLLHLNAFDYLLSVYIDSIERSKFNPSPRSLSL